MSLSPESPYITALSTGLLYGLVYCTSSCLPYVSGYIAGIGAGFRKGIVVTAIFNFGRIAAYALIGGVIGAFQLVSQQALAPFQMYSSYAFGIVTIIIGITILLKSRTSNHNCYVEASKTSKSLIGSRRISWFDVRAFSLGFSRGLIVCPPLLILLSYAAPFGAPIDSFIMAVLFGLGTALSPLLIVGGVTGWLLSKAPLLRKWISIFGGGALIVFGAIALLSAAMGSS